MNIIQNAGSHNKYLQTGKQLSLIVSNLEPDTQYKVKVRAKSASGRGPWSEVFTGRTLKEGIQNFFRPEFSISWFTGIFFQIKGQGGGDEKK